MKKGACISACLECVCYVVAVSKQQLFHKAKFKDANTINQEHQIEESYLLGNASFKTIIKFSDNIDRFMAEYK